ncbi:glycosyltransferase family A protein [Paracoccus benzoatiresistens]|uniref:Glycosyltransferase family A protein n=1 Tax=Paracoccus benzoatiresistens TaxID=2997341 RepID=A0ABT4J867_9RHOB|nr:glycosyltransferase family A protein [Paracoccus sp. EF6]MCZ0963319.1 glycosyltransferase family A protein [Paracoccus sp. EF6]
MQTEVLPPPTTGAVAIGRNEGERLMACLSSLVRQVDRLVYVDSGSTDNSVQVAREIGAEVVQLDLSHPFTAARARNAGFAQLTGNGRWPVFVQFVDGDCEVVEGWIKTATERLASDPSLAAVAGRRRELRPEASRYNRLIDAEWATPVGFVRAVGGDAMLRVDALMEIGGYREDLIAGEEPEMCLRLLRAGWRIERLNAEMTRHDAALLRFGQWWTRTRRAGHAFAEGAALHGRGPERHWVAETRRALIWGAVLPACVLASMALTPAAAALLMVYPLQVARLSRRIGAEQALFMTLGKVPEAMGAIEYYVRRTRLGRARGLIEYK